MSNGIYVGNVTGLNILDVAINPASVAAATSAEQTFTVNGVKVGDSVFVIKPSLTAGLGIGNARVSATDTVAITFINATAGAVDAGLETYKVIVLRQESGSRTIVEA